MPIIMKEAVEECIDTFNRTRDPQLIDLILDRALFTQMKEDADKLDNHFISELVLIMIDLININMFIRAKKIGKTLDFLNRILLHGGSINKSIFFEHLNSSDEEFISALRYTRYAQICEEGISDYKKTGNFTKLEKLFDNYIISFVKKTKYVALGVQPLVGFLLAKENEIKIIRIIMVGKINNISNDVIRERLRDTYV